MAAIRAEQERPRGGARSLRALALRAELREALAALVGSQPSQVALTSSTTDGCNIVLAGLGLSPADEVITTSAEHFGLLGALGAAAARVVVVEPEPERILAAVTAKTRLIAVAGVVDDRAGTARPRAPREAVRCSSTPPSRSVPCTSPPPASTFSRSPARSGCAVPTRRGRSS
jgi:beta-phosphoglucomutase-like phosphatase (HAD superfamily)